MDQRRFSDRPENEGRQYSPLSRNGAIMRRILKAPPGEEVRLRSGTEQLEREGLLWADVVELMELRGVVRRKTEDVLGKRVMGDGIFKSEDDVKNLITSVANKWYALNPDGEVLDRNDVDVLFNNLTAWPYLPYQAALGIPSKKQRVWLINKWLLHLSKKYDAFEAADCTTLEHVERAMEEQSVSEVESPPVLTTASLDKNWIKIMSLSLPVDLAIRLEKELFSHVCKSLGQFADPLFSKRLLSEQDVFEA